MNPIWSRPSCSQQLASNLVSSSPPSTGVPTCNYLQASLTHYIQIKPGNMGIDFQATLQRLHLPFPSPVCYCVNNLMWTLMSWLLPLTWRDTSNLVDSCKWIFPSIIINFFFNEGVSYSINIYKYQKQLSRI